VVLSAALANCNHFRFSVGESTSRNFIGFVRRSVISFDLLNGSVYGIFEEGYNDDDDERGRVSNCGSEEKSGAECVELYPFCNSLFLEQHHINIQSLSTQLNALQPRSMTSMVRIDR